MTDGHENDLSEEQLLARLAELAAERDGTPSEWFDAGRAAYSWRTIDAELAALTYDSELEDRELASVRGQADVRQLTFEASGLVVEIEIGPGPRADLAGQVVPPQRAQIEVRTRDGVVAVESDDVGRFSAPRLGRGPMSLRCRPSDTPDAGSVETGWVLL